MQTNELIIVIGLALIICILLAWVITLETKLKKLLGRKSGTLDEAIDSMRKDVDVLKKYASESAEHFTLVDKRLRKTLSGNETIRFNPFKGTGAGSNQSFATAFVNAEGDGVIVSSLYARDHLSVFSKPIKGMKSEFELTDEERAALQKAKESIV